MFVSYSRGQYFDGRTGQHVYSEAISTVRERMESLRSEKSE